MATSNDGLSELLRRVVSEYPLDQIGQGLTSHPVRDIVETELPEKIREVIDDEPLETQSSVGQGRWTAIPWLAILDTRETERIQEGVYVVYLFEPQEERLRLTLNQGVTSVKDDKGSSGARTQLLKTAEQVREAITPQGFAEGPLEFEHASDRNELYGPGTIYYKEYTLGDFPDDAEIRRDLRTLLDAYEQYVTDGTLPTRSPVIYQAAIPEEGDIRRNFENTVLDGVSREALDDIVDIPLPYDELRVWGNGSDEAADPGDYLLFSDRDGRHEGEYTILARVAQAQILDQASAAEFTERIGWGDSTDRVFPHVIFFDEVHEVTLDRQQFWDLMNFWEWPYDTYSAIDFHREGSTFFEEYDTVSEFVADIEGPRMYPDGGTGGYWNMVMTKRDLAGTFLEEPSEDIFRELVDPDHFWGSMAYQAWHRELFDEHTVDEVADTFRRAVETESIQEVLQLHQVGEGKATEILRALEPEKFAILNKRSRLGMETLGYELPDRDPSDDAYREFTQNVLEAYRKFDLREVMAEEKDEPIHPDATPIEIADWAFSEHHEGNIDLAALVEDGNGPNGGETYDAHLNQLDVDFDDIEVDPGALYFENWDRLRDRIQRALREGNHVLLFGPPGTGKTKLARRVCEAGVGPDGFRLVTGSSDWSTFDTVGGYQSAKERSLTFEPGVILERFHRDDQGTPANEWLVLDELNRADIDKAFGALFSALSGESVTLSYVHDNGENVEILDASQAHLEVGPHRYYIPEDWRMIATMNTLDKTSLYEMSYAFMRRWAFIPVGVPELPDPSTEDGVGDLIELVEKYVSVWEGGAEPDLDESVLGTIGEIWYTVNEFRAIGPAIVEDIYRYIRSPSSGGQDGSDFVSPIVMYIYPQLEGLRQSDLRSVVEGLAETVDDPADLRRTAEDFFQIDLAEETEA